MKLILFVFLTILTSSLILCQDLIPQQKKSKWGFVNQKGEWVIKPKFHEVKKFKEGYASVRVKNKWGFIDQNGKKMGAFIYSSASSFSNGFAAVRSLKPIEGNTRENNNQFKWGYIDLSGNLVIPHLFKSALSFDSKGRALVQLFNSKKNEQFWINQSGEAISPPFIKKIKIGTTYKIINQRVGGEKVYRYIEATGKPITDWYINDFNLDKTLIKVWLPSQTDNDTIEINAFKGNSKKKLCAYINSNGEVLSDWYSEIKSFKKGYAPIRHHHFYGFIDSTFKLIRSPRYREISLLNDSTYKGQIEYGKTVLLTIKGEEKSLYCHDFEPYSDSLFLGTHLLKSSYRNETKYAVFSTQGKQITGWYNQIHPIHNRIIRVEDERAQYSSDKKLEYQMQYNYVKLKSGDLISKWRPVTTLTWKEKVKKDSLFNFLFLNTSLMHLDQDFFKTVFIKEFEVKHRNNTINFSGGNFHNGKALVAITGEERLIKHNKITTTTNSSRYGYIDWYGNLIIPYKYEEAAAFRDEYAIIRKNGKYGAINNRGKTVIPEKYNLLGAYGSGVFPFLNDDGLWGYINRANRVQIPPTFESALPFSYGYASVKKGRYWGLIDVMGNEIMPFDYQKPIVIISPQKVKYLQSGVGYIIKRIDEL